MRHLFTIIFSFISLSLAAADQVEILSQSRDHYLDQAISAVRSYCNNLSNTTDAAYICRQQLIADCSMKKGKSCEVLEKVTKLEKQVQATDANIASLHPTPMYSTKTSVNTVEEDKVLEKVPQPSSPTYVQVKVHPGSAAPTEKTAEANKAYKDLLELQKKISAYKVRVDCSTDEDCKFQQYGDRHCGGPVGNFVYSNRSENIQSLLNDVSAFNELDKLIKEKYNKGIFGSCDWRGRDQPAKCNNRVCI